MHPEETEKAQLNILSLQENRTVLCLHMFWSACWYDFLATPHSTLARKILIGITLQDCAEWTSHRYTFIFSLNWNKMCSSFFSFTFQILRCWSVLSLILRSHCSSLLLTPNPTLSYTVLLLHIISPHSQHFSALWLTVQSSALEED